MVRPNPRLKVDIAEKLTRPTVRAAHHTLLPNASREVNHDRSSAASHFFNSLLDHTCAKGIIPFRIGLLRILPMRTTRMHRP